MNHKNRVISSIISQMFLLIFGVSDTIQQMIGFGNCPDFNSRMKDFDVAQGSYLTTIMASGKNSTKHAPYTTHYEKIRVNVLQRSADLWRPKLDAINMPDAIMYIGLWYEQYRHFISQEIGTSCTQVNLTNSEEGSFLYQITFFNSWNDEYDTITGTARFEAPVSEGKFSLSFPGQGNSSVKYNILDTDYESYSVVWSCENKSGYNLRNVWIFTREQHPLNETLQKAFAILKKHNLSAKFLIKSDQSNCLKPDIEYEIETDPDAEYIDDINLKKNLEEV